MSTSYTVHLTDVQKQCMEMICANVQDWIENAIHNRARIAQEDFIQREVKRRLDNNEQITTRDEMIADIYEKWLQDPDVLKNF